MKQLNKKSIKKIHVWVRAAIQLMYFLFIPSAYTVAFNGVKYIFTQMGTRAHLEVTSFVAALIVLCAGNAPVYGQSAGAELTISSFTDVYGRWASIFGAIAIVCFAFSTILGWGLYGSRCAEYLFGNKVVKPYLVIFSLVAILGTTVKLGVLWDIADTLNGLMAIPNLIAVALLSPVVIKLTKEYFSKNSQPDLTK